MYDKLTAEEMNEAISKINHIDDVFRLLHALEHKFTFVSTIVTRGDVEEEFLRSWKFDSDTHPGEGPLPSMTEEQWEKFAAEWFWRKGSSEILWDGVTEAIRWDLLEANLVPRTTVVE
jgi:hypothetical protein